MWGIDRLSGGQLSNTRKRLRSGTVAVLTHEAAVDRFGRQTLAALEELGVHPRVVFSPEHGLSGLAQAEEGVQSSESSEAGYRTVSLYGNSRESLTPSAEQFEGVDVLVIDLVDVGSRYYTYVWTGLLAARAAAERGVHTLVLDRPNPISGDPATVEGRPQSEAFLSFVGLESIPIRHALTYGEILAHFFAQNSLPLGPDGALSVIATRGWERYATAESWRRPFIPPSPNMPTLQTALCYPGGCLIEGTNLSEGRGTTTPFQLVGAPYLDRDKLTANLIDLALPGVMIRPVSFRPTFEKHANQVCHGVMLHVTDTKSFRPVTTYAMLIALARAQSPDNFAFRTTPYEFENEIPAFDLLTGSAVARQAILNGASPNEVSELIAPVDASWQETIAAAEARLEQAHA
jgi:uncharacterized protein YbbC (DUF1343 family)